MSDAQDERKRTSPPASGDESPRPKKLVRQVSSLEHHGPLQKIVDALHCEAVYNFYVARGRAGACYLLLFEKIPIRRAPGFGWLECTTVGSDLFCMPPWTVPGGLTLQYQPPFPDRFEEQYLSGEQSERAPEECEGDNEFGSEAEAVRKTLKDALGPRTMTTTLSWATVCNEVRRVPATYTTKHGRRTYARLASLSGDLPPEGLPEILQELHRNDDELRADDWSTSYQRAVWVTLDSFIEAVEETASQIRTEGGQMRLQLPKSSLCWAEDHWGRYLRIALDPALVRHVMDEFQTLPEFRQFLLASVPQLPKEKTKEKK